MTPSTAEGLKAVWASVGPLVGVLVGALLARSWDRRKWINENRKQEYRELLTTLTSVIDRTSDLKNWVEVFKSLVSNTKVLKIFAFSNNHYAGHGPATAKLFMDLWNKS